MLLAKSPSKALQKLLVLQPIFIWIQTINSISQHINKCYPNNPHRPTIFLKTKYKLFFKISIFPWPIRPFFILVTQQTFISTGNSVWKELPQGGGFLILSLQDTFVVSNHSWKQIFRGKHKLPFRDPKDATTEIWYKSLDFAVAILIEADNPFLYITLSFASSLNASWSALPLFNRENVFRSCWKQQTGQPVKPSYQWLKIPLKYEYSSTLSTSKWTVNIEVVTCYPCLWNRILQNILDM